MWAFLPALPNNFCEVHRNYNMSVVLFILIQKPYSYNPFPYKTADKKSSSPVKKGKALLFRKSF